MIRTVPTIDVVNHSSVVTGTSLSACVAALQIQVSDHFKRHWGQGCKLAMPGNDVRPGNWGLVIFDDSDQAGALGYHDLTSSGYPLSKVFAKTDIDNGYNWTITTSHELLEMLADPWVNTAVQVAGSTFYALEVADACEADEYGYSINGVTVSDFVFPHWFDEGVHGRCDYGGHIQHSRDLLPGGYIGQWTPSGGWTQKTARAGHAPKSRRLELRRRFNP